MDILNDYKKCCFSGYRPSKFPFKLNNDDIDFNVFQKHLFTTIQSLIDDGCRTFYCGMAMGFDIIAAETVILLKKSRNFSPTLELVCAVPFKGQENCFPDDWKERYNRILESCDKKIILSDSYFGGCYFKRNHYMVDKSDYVLTWFDGKRGGTMETLNYAAKKRREVINLYRSPQLTLF